MTQAVERAPEARLNDVPGATLFRVVRPIKVTQHTALLITKSQAQPDGAIDSEVFCTHSITVTLRGGGDTHLVAALHGRALDPGEVAIFGRATIPAHGVLRLLRIAASCSGNERFESLIFEAFELASRLSMDDGRRGSPLRMQRLKRFIEQEYHNDLTLVRMAQVAGLSTFACLRQFKEATGTTPHAYLLECRIRRARGLLCANGTTIASVARAAGFPDQAYFARIFKKSTGLTPMQYRHAANGFG